MCYIAKDSVLEVKFREKNGLFNVLNSMLLWAYTAGVFVFLSQKARNKISRTWRTNYCSYDLIRSFRLIVWRGLLFIYIQQFDNIIIEICMHFIDFFDKLNIVFFSLLFHTTVLFYSLAQWLNSLDSYHEILFSIYISWLKLNTKYV